METKSQSVPPTYSQGSSNESPGRSGNAEDNERVESLAILEEQPVKRDDPLEAEGEYTIMDPLSMLYAGWCKLKRIVFSFVTLFLNLISTIFILNQRSVGRDKVDELYHETYTLLG